MSNLKYRRNSKNINHRIHSIVKSIIEPENEAQTKPKLPSLTSGSALFSYLSKRKFPDDDESAKSKTSNSNNKDNHESIPLVLDENMEFNDSDLELNFDDFLAKRSQ